MHTRKVYELGGGSEQDVSVCVCVSVCEKQCLFWGLKVALSCMVLVCVSNLSILVFLCPPCMYYISHATVTFQFF